MAISIKLILLLLAMYSTSVVAQDFNERIALPLSNPSERGKLEVGLIRGDLTVESYNGDEVIIKAFAKTGSKDDDCKDCESERRKDIPAGMKRISSSPVQLSATEKNNVIEIETNSWKKPINLVIKVPSKFDLDISTVHGKIVVSGVDGTHEISAVNGPLKFVDMRGSVVSNTVNGDIIAEFKRVNADEPMQFVTLNGDVDVTFPSSIKAKAKMRSEQGEIFTDFEMSVDRSAPQVKSSEKKYEVSINSWVYGEINGGGPEYTFKNMRGDIIIRKK